MIADRKETKMDVLVREVPEQIVITEQRMVDQAALESWLPGAMARVHKAAGDAAAARARWISAHGRTPTGPSREVYVPGIEPLFAAPDEHVCDVAMPISRDDGPCRQGG